jgi:MFS transporter, OCT family, solute carrier family 22 (organic cation transporter), member 4/5
MAYMWMCCSFSYYMIIFYLKYLPGDIYNNSLSSSGTDLVASICGGALYSKLGIKKSFTFLWIISTVGGLVIIFLGANATVWMPIFVVITKFGISACFIIVYVATVDVFPTLFSATALGFCNFFARVLTIVAPQVAEVEPPVPMIVLTSLCFGAALLI